MHIKDALDQLGKQIGVPDLALDENGVCRMIFDRNLVVDLEQSDDASVLHIHSTLTGIPAEGRETLYGSLLAANLFGAETGGAVFALDIPAGEVVLFKSFRMDETEYQDFVNGLENFVQQIENWKERLGAPVSSEVSDRTADAAMPSGNYIIRG